jgi:hypothetical protein
MINQKTLDQFMCDFFSEGDLVEINANFLQNKMRNLIQNERLLQAQLLDYKTKYERAMMKIDCLQNEQLVKEIENNVRYRIDVKG